MPAGALVSRNVTAGAFVAVKVEIGVQVARSLERCKVPAQLGTGANWRATPFVMVWMCNCGGMICDTTKAEKFVTAATRTSWLAESNWDGADVQLVPVH